jgi:hypothetical protein
VRFVRAAGVPLTYDQYLGLTLGARHDLATAAAEAHEEG